MKIKANYGELDHFGLYLLEKSQAVSTIVERMQLLNQEIPNYWFGPDSKIFVENQNDYLKKTYSSSTFLKNMSDVLRGNAKSYMKECDFFDIQMKKEVSKYE